MNDEITQEMAFYTKLLMEGHEDFMKFQPLNIPFLGPVYWYAEMVKTDVPYVQKGGDYRTQPINRQHPQMVRNKDGQEDVRQSRPEKQ